MKRNEKKTVDFVNATFQESDKLTCEKILFVSDFLILCGIFMLFLFVLTIFFVNLSEWTIVMVLGLFFIVFKNF